MKQLPELPSAVKLPILSDLKIWKVCRRMTNTLSPWIRKYKSCKAIPWLHRSSEKCDSTKAECLGAKRRYLSSPLPVSPPKSKRGNLKRLDGLNRELTAVQADRIGKEANYRLTLAENAELTSRAEPNALIEN